MNTLLIVLGAFASIFVMLFLFFWIKTFIPSPKFSPAEHKIISQDYWPTDGFQKSTPEHQGMDSEKLSELYDYCMKAQEKRESISID